MNGRIFYAQRLSFESHTRVQHDLDYATKNTYFDYVDGRVVVVQVGRQRFV